MPNSEELKLDTIRLDWAAEGVAVATLDRPDQLNAMTMGMFAELEQVARHLGERDEVRVLILTGAGRAFCAGYDLADAAELPELSPMGMLDRQERAAARCPPSGSPGPGHRRRQRRGRRRRPGPGLAADIRLASRGQVQRGFRTHRLSPAIWVLLAAARLIGPALAAEIAYTGRFVRPPRPSGSGWSTGRPAQDLLAEALAMAALICATRRAACSCPSALCRPTWNPLRAALELENRGRPCYPGRGSARSAGAFRAKRALTFTGR